MLVATYCSRTVEWTLRSAVAWAMLRGVLGRTGRSSLPGGPTHAREASNGETTSQRGYLFMTTVSATPPTNIALATSLNQVLADSYALMALTHLAHWNVEGPGFFALHTAFQTQYEELFLAVDTIAERLRALDAYAIGGLGTLGRTAGLPEMAAPRSQEDYVRTLIAANEKVVADAAATRDLASTAHDAESQDLMIERITLHQKTIWMLRSFLKG